MMRPLLHTIFAALVAAQLAACEDNGAREESADALARDSALAHDLALASADTAPFSEAADVAMAPPAPDSASGRPPLAADSVPTSSPPTARVESSPARTVTESPGSVTPSSRTAAARASAPAARTAPARPSPRPTASPVARGAVTETSPRNADAYVGPSCASPALDDQRRCLLGYLARSDVALDKNYQALIGRLKREAGTKPGQKEPASVERLRVAQRAWLVYRDNECRRRNQGKEGPLWAPLRAQCLAEYSEERSRELANALTNRGG